MSAPSMSGKLLALSGPETTSVFAHGVNLADSAAQFMTRLVGHTISAGSRSSLGSVSHVSVCSVLPRPISSASSPQSPDSSRKRIQ